LGEPDPSRQRRRQVKEATLGARQLAARSRTVSQLVVGESEFMSLTTEQAPTLISPEEIPSPTVVGVHGRWWLAVLVGTGFSLPFSWLLSAAALLPFLLGLFFFALFGLIIGALVFRIACPRRPYRKGAVLVGTTFIITVCWITSIVLESRAFAPEMGEKATDATRSIGDLTRAEHIDKMADQVQAYLRDQYPPGGLIGYVRWSLTDGEIKKGILEGPRKTIKRDQVKHWWAIRVVLSIALLSFGVASQTWLLTPTRSSKAA
jgi:hypothetical protein